MLAMDNDIKSIVIPAFGGLCGGVPANKVCKIGRASCRERV